MTKNNTYHILSFSATLDIFGGQKSIFWAQKNRFLTNNQNISCRHIANNYTKLVLKSGVKIPITRLNNIFLSFSGRNTIFPSMWANPIHIFWSIIDHKFGQILPTAVVIYYPQNFMWAQFAHDCGYNLPTAVVIYCPQISCGHNLPTTVGIFVLVGKNCPLWSYFTTPISPLWVGKICPQIFQTENPKSLFFYMLVFVG